MSRFKAKSQGLLTMSEAATECGVSPGRFWRLVRQDGLLPKPATKCGRRMYYSAAEMNDVIKAKDALFGQRRAK